MVSVIMMVDKKIPLIIYLLLSLSLSEANERKKNQLYQDDKNMDYLKFKCPTLEEIAKARNESRSSDYIVSKGDDIYFLGTKQEESPVTFKQVVISYSPIYCLYSSKNDENVIMIPTSDLYYFSSNTCHVEEPRTSSSNSKFYKLGKGGLKKLFPKQLISAKHSSFETDGSKQPFRRLSPIEHPYEESARVYRADNPQDIEVLCQKIRN